MAEWQYSSQYGTMAVQQLVWYNGSIIQQYGTMANGNMGVQQYGTMAEWQNGGMAVQQYGTLTEYQNGRI